MKLLHWIWWVASLVGFHMRFYVYLLLFLFSLSVNLQSFPMAWADNKTLARLGTSVKDAVFAGWRRTAATVASGAEKAGEALADMRRKRIEQTAQVQWEKEHKKRFLRSKVNMMQQEKPEFIVFFAHGYRPKTTGFGYPKEKALTMVAPFLRSFRYEVYHPLLSVGPAYTTFAQKDDIDQVKFHLDRVVQLVSDPASKYYNLPIICAGHSNGAATLIALFGTYPDYAKNIAQLLLFAPYADVRKTKIFHQIPQKTVGTHLSTAGLRGVGMLYDPTQKTPLDYIENEVFPQNLPLFLVHSLDDKVIPLISNFTVLARALRAHGYQKWVHLFPFERGGHGNFLLQSTKEDRQKLRDALKTFVDSHVLKRAAEPSDAESSGVVVEHMLVDAQDSVSIAGGA